MKNKGKAVILPLLIIILALLVLGVSAYVYEGKQKQAEAIGSIPSPVSKVETTSDHKTFQGNNFSFQYPSSWEEVVGHESGSVYPLLTPDPKGLSLFLNIGSIDENGKTPQDLATQYEVSGKKMLIGGHEALVAIGDKSYIIFIGNTPERRIVAGKSTVLYGTLTLTFYFKNPSDFSSLKPVFDSIISTITFPAVDSGTEYRSIDL